LLVCWVFYYRIGSVPGHPVVASITLYSFPFLGQTHQVVVFVKKINTSPSRQQVLDLEMIHQNPIPVVQEKSHYGGVDYNKADWLRRSPSWKEVLDFGWGSLYTGSR
jgi:hypothetical protein